MDYKAFVSSTFVDLKEHRAHVISELRKAGFHVDPIEEWTSAVQNPKVLSTSRLDGCRLCVLLVARRRGHVPDGDLLSITQQEVVEAKLRGIDVLPFMLDDDVPEADWPWDEPDRPAVEAWRKDLRERSVTSRFTQDPKSVELSPALTRWVMEKQREIERANDEPGISDSKISPMLSFRLGGPPTFRRESTADEACLNAHEYAAVLADVLQTVKDDEPFSFALFGPWGRGKTYLMRLVERRLNTDASGYKTVFFSAWKYRTTPELWAHLYESLYAEAIVSGGWLVPIRTSYLRNGLWPATFTLLMLALSVATASQKFEVIWTILGACGFVGTVYIASSIYAIGRAVRKLRTLYWVMPRHKERLGLQFAIGDDLKALLCGWIPDLLTWRQALKASFASEFLATLAYAFAVLSLWWVIIGASATLASQNLAAGLIGIATFLAIAITAICLPVLLLCESIRGRQRVLLVIDDLDRCNSDEMLEVIECLQLFLNDDEIKRRLRLVMLIDHEILAAALKRKYASSLPSIHQSDTAEVSHWQDNVVRHNVQKLFLLWLRLSPLSEEEMARVIDGVCSPLYANPTLAKTQPPLSGANIARSNSPVVFATSAPETSASPIDTSLSEEEARALTEGMKACFNEKIHASWGPRALRNLVLRYQLSRMLLRRLGMASFSPRELVDALLRADVLLMSSKADNLMDQVAAQVS